MIRLSNVTKEYRLDETNSITPLRGVSLEVGRGEFVMIVGRSGSGKTTLLNLCAGLIKPTTGQVVVEDVNIQNMNDDRLSTLRNEKIGFIFQFQSILPNLTAIENVALPAFASRNIRKDVMQRAAELLESVGLLDRKNFLPRELSAGELRRVSIARASINCPRILLADEPTADLDEQTELNIVEHLRSSHKSGVTILMITHNLDLLQYSTRIFKLESGYLSPIDRAKTGDF